MSNQSAQPSPELFFSTVNAFQHTEVMRGAIELSVFTAIAEGNTTAKALAAKCDASERGMRILCDYLTILGFLTKESGQYGLTQDSALFLDRRSPAYLGGTIEFLLAPLFADAFKDMAAVVRKGSTLVSDDGSVSPENPVWVRFARVMMPLMVMPAQFIAQLIEVDKNRKIKVLDIAASHGIFGITFAQKSPNIEVVAVDWAPVLEVARENAQKFGVIDRYRLLPGSAFEVDFGGDYDLVLLTNFLHHFDVETNEKLLKKIHAAMNEGGRVVTLDFVPNEDRVSPTMAAGFSMVMLASTRAGDAYTFAEFEKMFSSAGFSRSEMHVMPHYTQQIVISYK
ncbi:MAG: methyltransferase domain-containing protein [Acidobacteria bacterium]|nr:methyltransferase domain-containing protein [Acidobacteriota bacterium]